MKISYPAVTSVADLDIRLSEIRRLWEREGDDKRRSLLNRLRVRKAEADKLNNENPSTEVVDENTFLELPSLFSEYNLELMSLKQWREKKEEIVSQEMPPTLLMVDEDFSKEEGGTRDAGLSIIREVMVAAPADKILCALLTHNPRYQLGTLHEAWKALCQREELSQSKFVLIPKRLIRDLPMGFAWLVKLALLNGMVDSLKTTARTILQDAEENARKRLDGIDIYDFDQIVLRSSRREGVWEPDTLFRVFGLFHQDETRKLAKQRSLDDVEARWKLHLKPFFGDLRAIDVSSDLIARYVDKRQEQKAKNATINRELAALKRMFHLGYRTTPPKVNRIPAFPRLAEDNVRKGFLEDRQYEKLFASCPENWFRAIVEVGRTYGWRIGELLSMRVKQVDLLSRTIRLEPGTTKNRDGREVTMTNRVYELLKLCVFGKTPEDFVFSRSNGNPVRDFRGTWAKACEGAGVPGLLFHDLRRTAARNLRKAGVAEGVIMKIGGWRTRSVFERYAIVSQSDIAEAIGRLEMLDGHSHGHSEQKEEQLTEHSRN